MIQLIINFDEMSNTIQVTGTILNNKTLAYGVLELAKDAIRKNVDDAKAADDQQRILTMHRD